MINNFTVRLETLGLLAVASAMIAAILIVALRPILIRYTLARPNNRSSHREPTPQGGGIAVIAATLTSLVGAAILIPGIIGEPTHLAFVIAATLGLTVVGATDDIHPLEAAPRLLLQTMAVAVVIATLPPELRVVSSLPWWLERAGLVIGGVWFVNLSNFMDGIDWMTVAEVVPVTGGLTVFGLMGALPWDATLSALALFGAILGFAPFNRPVARLFLGDVGSLPIGLIMSWMLILLAGAGHLVASLLLPLYYLADATTTLLRRLLNGEQVTQAHRSHFYQRAIDRGLSVHVIVGRVFAINVVLVALALVTLLTAVLWVHAVALIAGCIFVGWLLHSFENRKK